MQWIKSGVEFRETGTLNPAGVRSAPQRFVALNWVINSINVRFKISLKLEKLDSLREELND
jgi:hypothetical protein